MMYNSWCGHVARLHCYMILEYVYYNYISYVYIYNYIYMTLFEGTKIAESLLSWKPYPPRFVLFELASYKRTVQTLAVLAVINCQLYGGLGIE